MCQVNTSPKGEEKFPSESGRNKVVKAEMVRYVEEVKTD